MGCEVILSPASDAEFTREYETNLRHGRAFVRVVVEQELLSDMTLVVVRPFDDARITCAVRVVMKLEGGPMCGTALELRFDDEAERARLARFFAGEVLDNPAAHIDEADLPDLDDLAPSATSAAPASEPPEEGDEDADEGDETAEDEDGSRGPQSPIARLRKLGMAERIRLARDGHLEERVMLERLFGKSLWEELLRNPQITVPEVARIAAKGTAPRILLEQIVDNPAWSRQSIVRRALLTNPRVSPDGIQKLLRGTPKPELKLIVHTAAYPALVRASARKLLDP